MTGNKQDGVHSSGLLTKLGLVTAILIVVSSMIGSGIFKKAAPMADDLESGGLLLLCWVIAGLITMIGAATNAEIAGLIAAPGGQYVYFKEMYGKAFAFIYGWSCFSVIQSASIASIAYVFSESVNAILPLPRLGAEMENFSILGIFYPFASFGVKALTIATIIFLTVANYLGVIFGGIINNIFTSLKVLGILIIITLGLTMSGGSAENVLPIGPNPTAEYGTSLGLFGAMFAAMLGAFWAYDGWNNIGYLGGEVKNPKKNIPVALFTGVGIVIGIYLLTNFVFLYVMPVSEIIDVAQKDNTIIAVEVMRKFLGFGGAFFISILIMVSTFGTTNGSILASSRIYFAMSRDKLFFKSAGNVHPSFKTPYTSLVIQGIWSCILVLSGTFDQLTDMVIFASFIFYGAGAFGVFILRRKMKDHNRPYKTVGYPVLPLIFVLFCITLVVVTIIQNPRDAGFGLLLVLSGIPFYLYWNRRGRN
ncbi:MAG TPA: amino acid permease [Ignavibacteria bacterium]|nr:amino acid permease [Bacteroidota bacterium]HRI84802.1 amino acid permease [Ignavibacteria bacterium]HRJ99243.1 amino acid permease [Ignavibacteria bacterium]